MNDDVKAANEALVESMVRQLRDCVSVGDEMTLDHASLIDDAVDWIAGEAARTAAAVAAAREEQAQSDLTSMMHSHATGESWSCNLTATPLADRIAELERVLAKSLANRIVEKAKQADQPCGHPAAVANRSAETGVAFCDLCRLNEMLNDALAMEAKHKAERDALRDQVEEARAGLTEIACFHEGPEVHGGFDEPGSAQTARDTLAAMDEAKP